MNALEQYRQKQMNEAKQNSADEIAAAEWIKNNPHVAMRYAVEAHAKGWRGCGCALHNEAIQLGLVTK